MPKPRPPKVLKIGPFLYHVKIDRRAIDKARAAEGDPELLGSCDHRSGQVAIEEGLPPSIEREVLLHEVLHACIYAVGAPLGAMASNDAEEDAVRVIAPALLSALRENEHLVTYLTAP